MPIATDHDTCDCRDKVFINLGSSSSPDEKFTGTVSISTTLLWLVAIAGLTLSVMSVLKICTSACRETAKFTIFGMDFGWFGIVFFAALAVLLGLRRRLVWVYWMFSILIFAATGAEFRFIWA